MKRLLILALLSTPILAATKPVEVNVRQVNDRRSSGSFAQLMIHLELPKVPSTDVAGSRVLVKTAVDETGRDLTDANAEEPRLESGMGGGDATQPAVVSITLKNPDRKATKLKEVRGEIELFMPAKDPNSVAEVPKFLSFAGKNVTHKALKANGIEIALFNAAQVEAEKKRRGDSYFSVEESDLLARIKDPNKRIQDISYVDSKGEAQRVIMRDDEGVTILSTWSGPPQPDWKLRVSMKTPKNLVRYPFAVTDVPLP